MTDRRLTIRLMERGDKVIAMPTLRRVEVAAPCGDRIAEADTEEECLKAVEEWIEAIPVYPVPQPVHPAKPSRPRRTSRR